MRARLAGSREIGPEIRHFLFEAAGVAELVYKPGQFVSVVAERNGKTVTRAYSIASAASGNRFELCLNRVNEGMLSPWMFELRAGDEIEFNGPLGYFVPKSPFRSSVFVATGTGIAPFRAFLQDAEIRGGSQPVRLLFGARYEAGLVFRDEFQELQQRRPGFRFLPTITRPEAGWQGRTGWVQQHLEEALSGLEEPDVYICGLKAMVDAVRSILKERGFDRRRIVYEKYD